MPGPRCGIDIFAPGTIDTAMLRYRSQTPAHQSMLSLAADLAAIQARAYEMLGPASDPAQQPTAIPSDWLESVLGRIVDAVADQAPQSQGLRELGKYLAGIDLELLAEAARGQDSAIEQILGGLDSAGIDVGPPVILYIITATLQPYLAWQFASRPELAQAIAYPPRRDCPACGGKPMIGKHAEPDGQRFLRCSACGHEWAYPRMLCASCQESDQANIEVVFTDDDEGHRLYLCNTCQRYLKISDERLLGGPVYLPLEDIATLHLDELACDRGYAPVTDGDSEHQANGKH